MRRLLITLIALLAFSFPVTPQKRVHVREYRRKDGTVVRAHDRRAPSRTSTASPPTPTPTMGFRDQKFEPSPLDELSKLVLRAGEEPYEVVDLGDGSTYTPGGTGVVRSRRTIVKIPVKLTPRETAHLNMLRREVVEATRRFNAANSILRLFLNTPPDKQIPGYSSVVENQQAEVEHYADALEVSRRELLTFERSLSDVTTRKVNRP